MSTPQQAVRVMLVDDEPDIRTILTHILQPNYEVVTASNGLEALERLDRYEPDFIVMDVMMPVLDGFDTTRAIKKDMRFTNVPVLFLTARKDNQSVRDALLSGGEIYLEKPFSPPELLVRIDEIISRHKLVPRQKRFTLQEIETYLSNVVSAPPVPAPVNTTSTSDEAGSQAVKGAGSAPPPAASAPDPSREPRPRVLVVDDDADILALSKAVLEKEYEVITTTDSEGALDKIVAYQPDLLLLDITMPKLNGFHLAYLIRLNRRLRGARIVFISSHTDQESVERAFYLGATEFVEKPFTPEHLARKIGEITRRPEFQRSKKRIDFREIQRRENSSPGRPMP